MTEIETQPVPDHIGTARAALAGVLAGEPNIDVRLAASLCLELLNDVRPPYPPLGLPNGRVEPRQGIATARRALAEAVLAANTLGESLRIGRAGAELSGAIEVLADGHA